jgi:hypothetical protein
MANLTLVYGLRLLPSEEVAEIGDATLKLKNGREAHVTMHLLEGSKDEIEKQLKTSLEAFFDFYPEILTGSRGDRLHASRPEARSRGFLFHL